MILNLAALSVFCGLFSSNLFPAYAADRVAKSQRIVENATKSLEFFVDESNFTGLWHSARNAKAMVIIPKSTRAGFIFGGSAGDGVILAKNEDGSWSGPTFMTLGSVSFGLQAGGEVSELVLLAMTNRGKERILASNVKLGGDVTIAAGPIGIGAKAKTADILAYSRSRGLYGGLSLEGSLLKIRKKLNRAYYGGPVTPYDIVFKGVQDRPTSLPLRNLALRLANKNVEYLASKGRVPKTQTVQTIPVQQNSYAAPSNLNGYDQNTYNASQDRYDTPTSYQSQYNSTTYTNDASLSTNSNAIPPLAGGQEYRVERYERETIYEDDAAYGVPLQQAPIDSTPLQPVPTQRPY